MNWAMQGENAGILIFHTFLNLQIWNSYLQSNQRSSKKGLFFPYNYPAFTLHVPLRGTDLASCIFFMEDCICT